MTIQGDIYSGVASFGKLQTIWGAIISSIIGIILIFIAINQIKHKVTLTSKTNANIINVQCESGNENNNNKCKINIRFNDKNNKTITTTIVASDVPSNINSNITIYYNPNDPTKAALQPDNEFKKGLIILGIAILLIIIPWIYVWLSFHFKFFAAIEGVEGIYNIINN